jgi:hypothetical protein
VSGGAPFSDELSLCVNGALPQMWKEDLINSSER